MGGSSSLVDGTLSLQSVISGLIFILGALLCKILRPASVSGPQVYTEISVCPWRWSAYERIQWCRRAPKSSKIINQQHLAKP